LWVGQVELLFEGGGESFYGFAASSDYYAGSHGVDDYVCS